MKKRIPNHHDKIVKDSFSKPEIAKAYFAEFLPESLKNVIDIQSLSYVDGSFIDEEFSAYFSDLLFQFKVKDSQKRMIISLLFEHKAYPDKMVLVQVGNYIFSQWTKEIKAKQDLVPIIPFIYYQGKKTWKIKALSELFKAYPIEIQSYIPHYEYLFFAIQSLSKAQLDNITDIMLQLTLMGHDQNLGFENFVQKIESIMTLKHFGQNDWNYLASFFVYKFALSDLSTGEVKAVISSLPSPINEQIMSTYDAIKQEGKIEGEQLGIQKGKIEVVLTLNEDKIPPKQISKYTKLSESQILEILKSNGRM